MKKLIMLAMVAILAIAAQASSVSWKVGLTGQGDTLNDNGAFVLAFAGSDYDAVVKLVTETGSETLQSDLAGYALVDGVGGTKDVSITSSRNTATATGRIDDSPDSVFWMIFTDGSYDSKSAVTWTAATDVTGNFYELPATGTTLALNAASFANSGTIADVPEPTSGLLLIVGGALLALRRKQK